MIINRHESGDEAWIEVEDAKPDILIGDDFLARLQIGEYPFYSLTPPPEPVNRYAGWVLKLHDRRGTLVYRIGAHCPEINAWLASWPD